MGDTFTVIFSEPIEPGSVLGANVTARDPHGIRRRHCRDRRSHRGAARHGSGSVIGLDGGVATRPYRRCRCRRATLRYVDDCGHVYRLRLQPRPAQRRARFDIIPAATLTDVAGNGARGGTRQTATCTDRRLPTCEGFGKPGGRACHSDCVTDTPFALPPRLPPELIPQHVAVIMDGNGRWAEPSVGCRAPPVMSAGEAALFDVVVGAIEAGVKHISAYAFSTENWRRSPDEVRFLMGFNRDVIRRRRDEMHALGVRVRWAGRRPRLWASVVKELAGRRGADQATTTCSTLTMCVNYGGRAEIADAAREFARAGRSAAGSSRTRSTRRCSARPCTCPSCPTSTWCCEHRASSGSATSCCGRRRTPRWCSWTCLWPDVDRRTLYEAIDIYARRDRRYGTA